jgi:hypothetical protein
MASNIFAKNGLVDQDLDDRYVKGTLQELDNKYSTRYIYGTVAITLNPLNYGYLFWSDLGISGQGQLLGFIASPAIFYTVGGVDANDTFYCTWFYDGAGIKVYCYDCDSNNVLPNAVNDQGSTYNYLAIVKASTSSIHTTNNKIITGR